MTEPQRPDPTSKPRLISTLRDDVSQVTADVRKHGLRRELGRPLEAIEAFYLDADARQQLSRMGRGRRFFRRLGWLIKSLLLKLTPARRILLAFALVALVSRIQIGDNGRFEMSFFFPSLAAVLVLIILMLELKDKLIARNELVAGRAVQLALMPPESPAVPGWDVWLYTQPANDVGGDLVDHLQIDAERHGIALGDVAGKALPAALLMVKLQATVRALVPQSASLDALAAGVNRILHRDGLPNRFATLVYLVLTANQGHVRYVNAGHLPPLVIRGSAIEELPAGSMALGFIADAPFSEQTVDLASGDTLVAFSDGVVEAINAAEEFFGDERLRGAVQSALGQPAQAVGQAILASLSAFIGDIRPHDDVSVIVARRR